MENVDPNVTRVQHVAKASSDKLLSKFAEAGSDSNPKNLRLAKRVKRNQESAANNNSVSSLAEKKSLLPQRKKAALMRGLGISRAKIKAREIKNKSIVTIIEKTWRRTVEGASRVLMEKHYNSHKRLINESY
ncbi:hypothetical protein SASPL_120896 [Salvia splendens]|uniref:Uncharacterized protein n=1 Tax=Salvia splendens TaxID=180675 RepID=A0A8X8ZVL7_SALSN|nr:uncharacterized protein LOC121741025 [Salvia splendens]KAG6418692.1 hypothetical protein SASPL_120896 [Salvia splendens]